MKEKLLDACKRAKNIYCYGAGHYGSVVMQFLKMEHIKIESFIVTQKEREDYSGLVREWDSIKPEEICDGLIILSLHERIHDDVKNRIMEKCKHVSIFPMTEELFLDIPQEAHDKALIDRVKRDGNIRKENIPRYDEKAKAIISKYKKVLLRYIYSDRIGYLAVNWMYYNSIEHPADEYWVFYPGPSMRVVNVFLTNKILSSKKENMAIISENNVDFWKYMLQHYSDRIEVDATLPDERFYINVNRTITSMDKRNGKHFISLSREEKEKGQAFLEQFGLKDFVTVFARDGKYTQQYIGAKRDEEVAVDAYRDISIEQFSLTAKYLRGKGISSVRMGSTPEENAPDGIFDYGKKHHSDFRDVYLFYKCRYFLGTPSGLQHVGDLFSKYTVIVNSPVLSTENNYAFVGGRENLMIFQKYWDSKKGRYLTVKDMLRYEINGLSEYAPNGPRRTMWLYHKKGIIPVKNTPEEILAVVKEMEERLEGTVIYDALDMELQKKYESIVGQFVNISNFKFAYQIGRDFLRENQWLLE